jgi:hypothetical protein
MEHKLHVWIHHSGPSILRIASSLQELDNLPFPQPEDSLISSGNQHYAQHVTITKLIVSSLYLTSHHATAPSPAIRRDLDPLRRHFTGLIRGRRYPSRLSLPTTKGREARREDTKQPRQTEGSDCTNTTRGGDRIIPDAGA